MTQQRLFPADTPTIRERDRQQWAVVGPKGELLAGTVQATKQAAIAAAMQVRQRWAGCVRPIGPITEDDEVWKLSQEAGYVCMQVEVRGKR